MLALDIPGAPGYQTYTWLREEPFAVGSPWGSRCKPVVFIPEPKVPSADLPAMSNVISRARSRGIDVELCLGNVDWYPSTLYPAGLTVSKVEFVPIEATTTPSPFSIVICWNSVPAEKDQHDRLTHLQGVLELDHIGSDIGKLKGSIRKLIGASRGVWISTTSETALGPPPDTAQPFSAKEISAMMLMNGCPCV